MEAWETAMQQIRELKAENERLREYVEQLRHERDMLQEQLGIPQALAASEK